VRLARATTLTGLALAAALALTSVSLAQDAQALPATGESLNGGRYSTDVVGPSISFDGHEGWIVGPVGPGPIFTLLRRDEPGTVLSVTRFDGAVFVDSCDPTSLSEVEATAARLMAVIAGNPFLNPGAPVQVEVDGRDAWQLDVATPAFTECQLDWLLIFALPVAEGGEFIQVADQQARFIAVDVDGTVVVVAVESLPGVPFGELLEASLQLVDSMTIEPAESALPDDPAAHSPDPGASQPLPSPGSPASPSPSAAVADASAAVADASADPSPVAPGRADATA
jgi:hypothetical protein